MTSEEFADSVDVIVRSLRTRILGVGAEQYDDGSGVQRFESRSLPLILGDALEEVDDLIVYLAQVRLRIMELLDSLT